MYARCRRILPRISNLSRCLIRQRPPQLTPRRYIGGTRQLNDIVNTELLEGESTERIKEIWMEYHKGAGSKVAAVLSPEEFEIIQKNSKIARRFIYPIPTGKASDKASGKKSFFVLYAEFQDNFCILTSLEAYRMNKGDSYPYMVISVYDDVLDSRDVV
eukprot:700015_1